MRLLYAALLLALATPRAGAQSNAVAYTLVNGRLVTTGRASPPPGTVILMDGTASGSVDSTGAFQLVASAGRHRIIARAIGYVPADTTLDVAGAAMTLELELRRNAVSLDSMKVVAVAGGKPQRYANTSRFDEFYERKRTATSGVFLTREDIEAKNVMNAMDLFRNVVGVTVRRNGSANPVIRFERCVSPPLGGGSSMARDEQKVQLFVNGMKVGDPFGTLDLMKADDIEAMEVYQGVAQLPDVARGDGCAAIFVWTRYAPGALGTKQ